MRTGPETVLTVLERVSATRGAATAVSGRGRRVSYAELWQQSGEAAVALERLGTTSQKVAIAMRRGPDAVLAMLAVLRSGAAFGARLDPANTTDRQRAILADSGAGVLVTEVEVRTEWAPPRSGGAPSGVTGGRFPEACRAG